MTADKEVTPIHYFTHLRDQEAAPDRTSLYVEGMTQKQWFDVALKCGELPRDYDSYGQRPVLQSMPCGASDWRVIRDVLMAPWERALQCNKCKLWTLVELPDWKRKLEG